MKIVGQIKKTHYEHKRSEFSKYPDKIQSSPYYGKRNILQHNSIQKPLREGSNEQISFKGFSFSSNPLKPIIKPIPQKLFKKAFKSLKDINPSQYEEYKKIINEYIDFIKIHTNETSDATEILKRKAGEVFRKKHGITDEMAKNISEENLFYLPKQSTLSAFLEQTVAPFKFIYKGIRKIFVPNGSETARQEAIESTVLKKFSSFEGLLKSHEIWENGYRKMSGNPQWTEASDFLIPDDVLYAKIKRRRNKFVDPNKGKYSSTSMMLGNRFISGVIYSYFLGTDAYNTTMRYSNNKEDAAAQRSSRVAQEFSRIGLNMYIQNLLFGTFETAVNKSLSTAMLASGSTVLFSEVLGRKLVGKPIIPSNKETLDKLEDEMAKKKGILPAIGRLLTNVKKKEKTSVTKAPTPINQKEKANVKVFSTFTQDKTPNQSEISQNLNKSKHTSFKGFYAVDHLCDKTKLTRLIKAIELADAKTAQSIKTSIMKSIEKSKYFVKNGIKEPKTFEELINMTDTMKVPVGTEKTKHGLLVSSFLLPVKFVKNIFVKLGKGIQKLYYSITKSKNPKLQKQLEEFSKTDFYKSMMELEVWKKSPLPLEEKQLRLFNEFKDLASKDKEEIEGVKNILQWLDKQLTKENIHLNSEGTLDEKSIKRVKELLIDSVLKADSAKHVEYDGNTLAQTNINLSRAITTLFLMTDAYNLTMQYSNDNKKEANKSATNRAAQEISRIGVSAYILAFVHNLLSKLCNSSLTGAFTLTAITSSINDSISRKVVGVPLSAKSQEELHEIDIQNSKSKSPIKKALAYSIGKKSAIPKNTKTTKDLDYFKGEFFIQPHIS